MAELVVGLVPPVPELPVLRVLTPLTVRSVLLLELIPAPDPEAIPGPTRRIVWLVALASLLSSPSSLAIAWGLATSLPSSPTRPAELELIPAPTPPEGVANFVATSNGSEALAALRD